MKKALLTGLCAFALSTVSHAQTLVGFDFAGTTTDPLAAATVASDISVSSGLTRVDLGASSSANAFGSNGWNITGFDESTDYISFSLAPDAGYMVSVTSLEWTRLNASNTAPGQGRWGYSIGGGAFTLQDPFAITLANAAGSWSGIGIVDATASIEFRFWAFGATSVNGGTSATTGGVTFRNSVAGDDLVLNGSVSVVPEPSTLGLLTLAGLGLAAHVLRRRRR